MPRWALILNAKVVNVVSADDAAGALIGAPAGATATQTDVAGPGDDFDGGQFTRSDPAAPLPAVVSLYQFISALDDVLNVAESDVDAAIAGMSAGRAKRRLRAWWRCAGFVRRRGEPVAALQSLMGWTDAQLRQVFAAAAGIAD